MKTFKEIVESWINTKSSWNDKNIHFDDVRKHYPKRLDKHLAHYQDGSHDINGYLWNKHKAGNADSMYKKNEVLEEHIKGLDHLTSSHKTPRKMVVWSGSRHDPREMKDENNIVHHPAFLSTSLHRNIAESFSTRNAGLFHNDEETKTRKMNAHLYKIHVPKNHPGILHPGDLSEREFILPRGTNLRYKGSSLKTEIQNPDNNKNIKPNHAYQNYVYHYHTHHMEVV